MTRTLEVLAAIAVLCVASEVAAQDVRAVSVDEAVAITLQQAPELAAARAEIESARGMRQQAALRPNPNLLFEQRKEPAGTDNQTTIALQWPLDLFRRNSRIAVATRQVTASEFASADRVRQVIGDVRGRYGAAAAAARELSIAEELSAAARRNVDLLNERVDRGAAPPLERDMQDVEFQRLEADRLLALGRSQSAIVELKRVMGLRAQEPLELRDGLDMLVEPLAAVEASRTPAVQRPDVQEAETLVRIAEAKRDLARNAGRFDVQVMGGYMRMNSGFPQRGFNASGALEDVHSVFHYLSAGAMVTMPIFNRNQGEVASAEAERVAADARLRAATLAAASEVTAAAAEAIQAARAAGVLANAVKLARQNLEVVRRTYELGRATIADVIAEQRRYVDVEKNYTAVLLKAFETQTALHVARGEVR
jgi:cobalt-zinc-cadmium efflux system outer membrane protein